MIFVRRFLDIYFYCMNVIIKRFKHFIGNEINIFLNVYILIH